MKIYISGQITGLPIEVARENFSRAAAYLSQKGFDVVDPMSLPHCDLSNWTKCMALDIDALRTCQGIYMLNNWTESKGASLELELSVIWGLNIFHETNINKLNFHAPNIA